MEGEGAGTAGVVGSASAPDEPRDARVVREILRSMGLSEGEYEPRVVHQLLELAYRYTVEVLSDAQVYAEHAGKPANAIDTEDVRLAIQSKVNTSFSQPPPREILLELARNRNKIPLPKSIAPPGSIPLPPDEDTLISPNYQLLIPTRQPTQNEEADEATETNSANPNANPNASMMSEQSGVTEQQSQQVLQRVSFQLGPGQRR
ncbi:Transcription initiation factor TFIID subunit 9 [Rhynchospora pubera]|uniref:Transcription initiation factor TFIID subunit 9 n=1 Tax=Rhynchospora pubera TaxID=906938 RepID=A0AAV8D5B2_9POAL|nr:Transcription initiation factor TFIID subunit 9 [Rhynchospora pubera]KAJ4815478.1 Transcription initiation factor TFIID subunit 9 [Rhynchospora pubera]